jgi:divalent metal cation (Fe/Co/Zn/Cd) transporter
MPEATDASLRRRLTEAAVRVSKISVAWALIVGVAAVVSGAAAGSMALVGFGLDSVIDGSASVVLVWRFRAEHDNPDSSARVERVAGRLVAVALLVVAAYIGVEAVRSLATRTGPSTTPVGVTIAAASLLVLPVLAVRKRRLATQLRSPALGRDGVLSAAGAVLAFIALLAQVLNNAFGWWWSDAFGAGLITVFLGWEGLRGLLQST